MRRLPLIAEGNRDVRGDGLIESVGDASAGDGFKSRHQYSHIHILP
jgi:hypothetical protein